MRYSSCSQYLRAISNTIFVVDPQEGTDEVEESRQVCHRFRYMTLSDVSDEAGKFHQYLSNVFILSLLEILGNISRCGKSTWKGGLGGHYMGTSQN